MFDFMAIFSLSGQTLLFRFFAVVVIVAVHGFALATLARLMGDPGPFHDGRMTLNPMAHLHAVGALAQVLFRFGWIKPMDIDPRAVRGAAGIVVLILASLSAVLLVGAALWAVRPLVHSAFPASNPAAAVIGMFEVTARMTAWFVVINLIPLPPFTAGLLLSALAPSIYRWIINHLTWVSIAIAAILFSLVPQALLLPAIRALEALILF